MIYKKSDAFNINKKGVDMWIYNNKDDCAEAAIAYQETSKGHSEEFNHTKSTFIYYIIEGSGIWIIENEEHAVQASDVVIVPPGKSFYFRGNLKQICITAPAWEEKYENHVRNVTL